MTQKKLFEQLKSIGFPITYSHFDCDGPNNLPQPPLLVYYALDTDDLIADNINYITKTTYALELYTDSKELETEKKVENKLNDLGLPFTKEEEYIKSERLYQVYYEFEIIGG